MRPLPCIALLLVLSWLPQAGAQPPKAEEPQEVSYEARGLRDPFVSLVAIAKAAQKKKKKLKSPLQEYDVSQFQLLAIVWNSEKYALVRLPNGKHYVLREGLTVGIHEGKVVEITPRMVVVEEITTDIRGRVFRQTIKLKLRKEEEG
jgi:Tfp pilus assembly protein PilP